MAQEKNVYTDGLIVKSHDTKRKADEKPRFIVTMKSLDKKITLKVELPDMGRQIFQMFPLKEVVEITIGEASQVTLDKFSAGSEEAD